jgi:hypothetical protein
MTAKAEPDLAEVNRLIRAEHDRNTVTIDVEYALAASIDGGVHFDRNV